MFHTLADLTRYLLPWLVRAITFTLQSPRAALLILLAVRRAQYTVCEKLVHWLNLNGAPPPKGTSLGGLFRMERKMFQDVFQDMSRATIAEKTGKLFSGILRSTGAHMGNLVKVGSLAFVGLFTGGPPGALAMGTAVLLESVCQGLVDVAMESVADAMETAAEFAAYEHEVKTVFTRFYETIRFDECYKAYRDKQDQSFQLMVDMDLRNKLLKEYERDRSAWRPVPATRNARSRRQRVGSG